MEGERWGAVSRRSDRMEWPQEGAPFDKLKAFGKAQKCFLNFSGVAGLWTHFIQLRYRT